MSYTIIKKAGHKCDLPGDYGVVERGDFIRCDCGQLWKYGFFMIHRVRG